MTTKKKRSSSNSVVQATLACGIIKFEALKRILWGNWFHEIIRSLESNSYFCILIFHIMAKNYWLLKSEPTAYSIDDLKRDGKTEWTGVRNYQARNTMRDSMSK